MHIHYTGWRQESNYVPMNFDGRYSQQPQQQSQHQPHQHQHQTFGLNGGSVSLGDHSLSFDSQHTGPSSLRDPFAPSAVAHPNHQAMTRYEIQVDGGERNDRLVPRYFSSRMIRFFPFFFGRGTGDKVVICDFYHYNVVVFFWKQ